ncbi:flagellin N-terminal helical domain-containing protein [Bacillus sp. FJAT-27231]|uniref:flagellin N-terminal helical domain-containing protein n=1 Tax=Bacillus sp. FJAT-27231 TaxID=1679168 RepID=UPI00069DEA5A
MRINHNIAALNTYRQLNSASGAQSKSMEKLSSGLRINRAGDDAAGLAISEKMRGQIRGLDMAAKNSQDGISMIQTAEGALNETHDILQRMKELATQAANGTNTDQDRGEIQKEINQLTSEVNRIGNTTEFNTKKLLNGGGVDPKSATKVSGNGLDIAAKLAGGSGITNGLNTPGNRATATIDIAAINATATTDDGKYFNINLDGREIKVTFDSTATNSGVSGNTITIKTSNNEAGADVATDIVNQLTSLINNDENLKGKYTASAIGGSTGSNKLQIQANAVSLSTDGKLQGALDGGSVTIANGKQAITTAGTNVTNAGSQGAHATQTIDFSKATIDELKGSEIVVNGTKIAFYDSADGSYNGNAGLSVDLNGARSAEKIVDAIVNAANNSGSSRVSGVYLTKTDGNKLQITASQSGLAGSEIQLGNNAAVTVTQTYGNNKLDGEAVTSAKGLADGEHKVTVSYVGTSSTAGTATGNVTAAKVGITVDKNSDLASGTYRLVGTANDTFKLEKLGDDGTTWGAVTGYGAQAGAASSTAIDYGDLKVAFSGTYSANDFSAGTDYITFSIDAKHFEATLTESGSNAAGTAVRITNGENNVTLTAEDGIGEAKVNIGGWDAANFAVDDTISWSFETKAAGKETAEVVGGTFTEKLQIGANNGQSFQVDFKDMRSQALNISGTSAGASQGVVEGAKFTATKDVTNGTNNDGAEFALDVSTHDSATAAIKVLDNAINAVSAERSKLGAYQNRLEHTINNLGTSSENLTAAESRIRDVDYALAA